MGAGYLDLRVDSRWFIYAVRLVCLVLTRVPL